MLIIRTATREEINRAITWASEEGWNPADYDAECYYVADPNGFFIGLLDNEPIAVISAIKYADSFGFLGFYIVKPNYRGQGYGMQIWNAGLNYLQGRNIGLDGVVAQQQNYKKSGFKLAYRNRRYEGISAEYKLDHQTEVINALTLPFEMIDVYLQPFFPTNRYAFIKAWNNQPKGFALAIIQAKKLVAYGVIRQCHTGYKIAPLFADNVALSETLFLALQSKVKSGEPIYLDTPETNQAAVTLAQRFNMIMVFETARMYTDNPPNIQLQHTYSVTSFEIG